MVTPDDVAETLGRTLPSADSAEYKQWALWITDAQLQIRLRLGMLDALDQEALAYVVREAVALKVKHPDDTTRTEVAVDDGRIVRQRAAATGQVTILDEWWALLGVGRRPSGAFSVRPSFTPDH